MNRRKRERREYLLQKEREMLDKEAEEKKRRLGEALESNTKIPHEIRKDAPMLLDEIIYEGRIEEEHRLPKVMVTTSRSPSSQLLHFAKHLSLVLNGENFIRGQLREEEVSDVAHKYGYTCVIIVHENRGRPASLAVSYFPFGPTMRFTIIDHFLTRRAFPLAPKAYFVCDNMEGTVGIKIKEKMALLFPQCSRAKRIVSLVNRNDTIAFRHYLIENGDRTTLSKSLGMDLRAYEIRKGTFEMDGEFEWAYKPYMNSRRTREEIGCTSQK
ncbi:IMP4-LIKE U3 SMALL NUCLEOLAR RIBONUCLEOPROTEIN (snoRNP) [Encephalitozoon cuniculi GB-M1]|uniref:U3 small nucleolar ribonucleoprotein protein IMP4 n=2 Tax=Encephalitozoon cuniculi TaxID=6035 RepID=Q8SQR5_ENCCU|nr:brix domain-containing protein [Encephalitozoon cuniculi GB-M1]AGE94940.1 imp4-like U3 small nucleolar ribonucleoprotein [Encephalitozoon cuniculi]KMV65149.1 brix domain-containing protein [Encephalitozoon cuniculi EcunIII-L]UYI26400.1 ribosome biogenesis protein BRX1 [Encephalitozoon cuniculi]CAD26101.1 IMP4-LIKE U3 SMALL NUCLEOLAR RIBONUCLEOPROTEIN (snoRNP) [Encephalitozoon cuniculi GB-M1]